MKDQRIAPENRMMSPVSEQKKKKYFLVNDCIGEAVLPVQKPSSTF